jgi:surface carbohydrate biosynthesis protein
MIKSNNLSFIFKKNKKKKIFLADNNYSKLELKNRDFYLFEKKNLNTYYLFLTFKEFLFGKKTKGLSEAYLKTIVESVDPKIIIDNELNGRGFKIKKIFPNLKVIIYQFGHYFPTSYNFLKKNLKNKKCDNFLVFNKHIANLLKDMKTKFIVSGSIKNNNRKRKNNIKKYYDIMFISEFRQLDNLNKNIILNYKPETHSDDYGKENYANVNMALILKILNNFSLTYKKKFVIAKASNREDKKNKISQTDEKIFTKFYAPNHLEGNLESEILAEKTRLIICMTSNLGAELLVKGHKVLFINSNFLTYEWVFKKNSISGPFWHKGLDEKKIFEKINYLLNISDKKFNKISKANFDLLEYDQNNTKLNKLLNI